MSVNFKAMIGVGYIVTKDKADEIYTEFPEFEDNLIPLDGWWDQTDYFFGEIFYECGPGEEREVYSLGEFMYAMDRIGKKYGKILGIKEDCPAEVHLIHQVY